MTPSELKSLVTSTIKTAEPMVLQAEMLEAGTLRFVADEDVDWSEPRKPTVPSGAVALVNDQWFWERAPVHDPTWLNLASYPGSDGGGFVIVTVSPRSMSAPIRKPGVAISGAPHDVTLTVELQKCN